MGFYMFCAKDGYQTWHVSNGWYYEILCLTCGNKVKVKCSKWLYCTQCGEDTKHLEINGWHCSGCGGKNG